MRRFVMHVISAWVVVLGARAGFAQDRPRLDFLPENVAPQNPAPGTTPGVDPIPKLPRLQDRDPELIPTQPRAKEESAPVQVGARIWSNAELAPLRPWTEIPDDVEMPGLDRFRYVPRNWQEWLTDYRDEMSETAYRGGDDFRTFYSAKSLLCVGVAIVAAAPIANTHADAGIRDWWQGHVRNPQSDAFFAFGNDQLGRWQFTGPILVGGAVLGKILEEYPEGGVLREFSVKSMRAIIVGAPAVGILQHGLGGSAPGVGASYWQPLASDSAVSGHAFVGSVPFLTAATMTDSYALKSLFIAGSLYAPLARINDDRTYFSQAALGYTIAVIATQVVFDTDMKRGNIQLAPLPTPDAMGLSVMMKY